MKKRGRPALPKTRKRRRELRVLVTEEEARLFETAAKASDEGTVSSWFRALGLMALRADPDAARRQLRAVPDDARAKVS